MSSVDSMSTTTTSRPLQLEEVASRSRNRGSFFAALYQFIRQNYFPIAVIALLLFGWSRRGDNYLSAEEGAGYVLGIIGGSLMLLVMLYPLSKRSALLARWIPVRFWFNFHVLFGIFGPVMVLFHSNFQLGSLNSTIALISMLLVVASGLVARFVYTRIHHGLYGKRITLECLKRELENEHTALLRIYEMDPRLRKRIESMENRAMGNYTSVATSLIHVLFMAHDARRLQFSTKRLLRKSIDDKTDARPVDRKVITTFIRRYTSTLRRIAVFRLCERLFALWRILHMPLYIMMVITAVVHIFAVHIYR